MFAYSCFLSACTGMNVSVLLSVLSAVLANKRVHYNTNVKLYKSKTQKNLKPNMCRVVLDVQRIQSQLTKSIVFIT